MSSRGLEASFAVFTVNDRCSATHVAVMVLLQAFNLSLKSAIRQSIADLHDPTPCWLQAQQLLCTRSPAAASDCKERMESVQVRSVRAHRLDLLCVS